MKEHASSHGISKLAMPRLGCVDDELKWVNVAICLEVVFQDSYFTISVYTSRDQEQMYPSTSARRGTSRSSSFDSACSVVTPEEMLVLTVKTAKLQTLKLKLSLTSIFTIF